jgi:hypothetical protein
MALAATATFSITDGNKTSRVEVRIPSTISFVDMAAFAQDMAQLIATVIQGQITAVSVCVGLVLDTATIKATATAFSDVLHKAVFQFTAGVTGFFKRLSLPAFDDGKTVVGSDDVDQTNNAVINFVTAMEAGVLTAGGTIQPVTDRDFDVDQLKFARESFRSKR